VDFSLPPSPFRLRPLPNGRCPAMSFDYRRIETPRSEEIVSEAQIRRSDRHTLRSIHLRGVPAHIRPDSGPEFVAMVVQHRIEGVGARTAPTSLLAVVGEPLHRELQRPPPRRAAQRGDLLHLEGGESRDRKLAAPWGYKPPALEVFIPAFAARAASQSRPAAPPVQAERPAMN
jgi:hypothetical protein